MSTGLTYVAIVDASASSPDHSTSPVVFASYEEAYEYGRWYVEFNITYAATAFFVTIKTFGPNQSGWWQNIGGGAEFIAFD
jgi:hypothetical protein